MFFKIVGLLVLVVVASAAQAGTKFSKERNAADGAMRSSHFRQSGFLGNLWERIKQAATAAGKDALLSLGRRSTPRDDTEEQPSCNLAGFQSDALRLLALMKQVRPHVQEREKADDIILPLELLINYTTVFTTVVNNPLDDSQGDLEEKPCNMAEFESIAVKLVAEIKQVQELIQAVMSSKTGLLINFINYISSNGGELLFPSSSQALSKLERRRK